MIPLRTKKLFISYRSSDAVKVDKIAHDLALLRYDNGMARYITWQDKHNLPPASPYWWDAIMDAIIDCDTFVFHLSYASLQSEICLAELDYAHKRNRPIITVVLEGEFLLNPQSGKYDLLKEMWPLVPDWLAERQFLFYAGAEFYGKFQEAMALFERNWPRDVNALRPLNPDRKSMYSSNHALYDAACDYAERLAFADAENHFDALVRHNDADYVDIAIQWLELIRLYAELIEIDERHNAARAMFQSRWEKYESLFPKGFIEGIFNPKGLNTPWSSKLEGAKGVEFIVVPTTTKSEEIHPDHDILLSPHPLVWIEITSKNYSIAKYPITNEQYAKFVEAGGYRDHKWWTEVGWNRREKESWSSPRYWNDTNWNRTNQPVVGVSWYEAMAYCKWLSFTLALKIELPEETEWQFAAQGEDERSFPWGSNWNGENCNNSVSPNSSRGITAVSLFEGRGDSPFGVVDMVGNTWEWCLTKYKANETDDGTARRIIRGGSWNYNNEKYFRCNSMDREFPHTRNLYIGFRVILHH